MKRLLIWVGSCSTPHEREVSCLPPATFDGSKVVYSYLCTQRLHAFTGTAESSNEKIQWLSAAVNSRYNLQIEITSTS